jgi:hypothetical protein
VSEFYALFLIRLEEAVRLEFKPSDGRVIDKDTGKQVGIVKSNATGGIDVWLFDGKYQKSVNGYEVALGFVWGVQEVLNHMTSCEDLKSGSEAA